MKDKIFYLVKQLLEKYFSVILILIVLISYGQTLRMNVWEDDNALFFKLAHLPESAGFLGPGIFGVGPYKYTATLYIPIYQFFGYNTFFYFAYALIFYILATLAIYKTFSYILGKTGGRITGFLFACGFIASEGFIRLFNSTITSLSIILMSGLLYSYWKFINEKRIIWYFLALVFFTASIEFASARTHYLISVIILFELIFLAFQKPMKSIGYSIFRLIPFLLIFYKYYILAGDSRNSLIGDYLTKIINGEFYIFYGLIATFANLIIPKWLIILLTDIQSKIILTTTIGFPFAKYFLLICTLILVWFTFRKNNYRRFLIPIYMCALIGWVLLSKMIFTIPILNLDETQMLIVTLGGMLLILLSVIPVFLIKERSKLSIFLFFWMILNILTYSIYNPEYAYSAENRYLAHSFFALAGLLGLFLVSVKENQLGFLVQGENNNKLLYKLTLTLILLWGTGNLISSICYQNNILITRSFPTNLIYQQLRDFVPKAEKGDIFYFDLAEGVKGQFKDAVAVAQMPETTALAWRYGIDRYDITKFEDFEQLRDYLKKNNQDLNHIYTFFYSKQGLVDTSDVVRAFLARGSSLHEIKPLRKNAYNQSTQDLVFDFAESVDSTYPMNLVLNIRAQVPDIESLKYPLSAESTGFLNNYPDKKLKDLMFSYQKNKKLFFKNASFHISSQWQDNIADNLYDQDLSTVWQANRISWKNHKESITIDLKVPQEIDRLVWVNGFSDQTPVEYKIETSSDGINWLIVKEVSERKRKDRALVIEKLPVVTAQFIKMTITNTLKGDAPAIAEIWPVPHLFSELDIIKTEEFLTQPFDFVLDKEDLETTLSHVDFKGNVNVYWKSEKSNNWQTNSKAKIYPVYDGVTHEYKLEIPANGTKLSGLKLSSIGIPGNLELQSLSISRSNLLAK